MRRSRHGDSILVKGVSRAAPVAECGPYPIRRPPPGRRAGEKFQGPCRLELVPIGSALRHRLTAAPRLPSCVVAWEIGSSSPAPPSPGAGTIVRTVLVLRSVLRSNLFPRPSRRLFHIGRRGQKWNIIYRSQFAGRQDTIRAPEHGQRVTDSLAAGSCLPALDHSRKRPLLIGQRLSRLDPLVSTSVIAFLGRRGAPFPVLPPARTTAGQL